MVDDLYQEIILDHSKRPRNFHAMEDANRQADGYNPLCGDKLKLFLKMEDDMVREASFIGSGCAISTASASLMTESLKGKTRDEALHSARRVSRTAHHRCPGCEGSRQARGLLRRARLSRAREVRHAGVAHVEIGARTTQTEPASTE